MASLGVGSPVIVLVAVGAALVVAGPVVDVSVTALVVGAIVVMLGVVGVAPGVVVPPHAASSSAVATSVGSNPRAVLGRFLEMPMVIP